MNCLFTERISFTNPTRVLKEHYVHQSIQLLLLSCICWFIYLLSATN